MFSAEQKTGLTGELWAAKQLELLGYNVRMLPDFSAQCTDMTVNGLPVEVKLSLPGVKWRKTSPGVFILRQRWQWKVDRVDTADRLLILIAEDHHGHKYPFVLPGAIMAHRIHFEINSHPAQYRGILADFLNNWSVVEYLLNKLYKSAGQLSLIGASA